jgi:2,6-dihydroxypseudooxynicotine hydrolase
MRAAHDRAVGFRNEALALLRPPGERVEIPWDGITLKANLRMPDGARRPPVVVMAMGLDSAKEEMDTNERVFLDRGMATLAFDGPGQGEGEYDRPICPEYERPVAAVIDWLEGRGDVDAARLGIWGVSLGGYYAPRAAAFDDRIRACISLTGPFDWEAIFDRIPPITRAAFTARSFSKGETQAREFSKRMTLRDCAQNITCPLYIVGGRLDRVVPPEEAEKLASAAAGPVSMNMIEDGTHVANNRIYKYRTQSADWMAAQLGG